MAGTKKEERGLEIDDLAEFTYRSSIGNSKTVNLLSEDNEECNLLGSHSLPAHNPDQGLDSNRVISHYQDGSELFFDRLLNAYHFITAEGESLRENLLEYSGKIFNQTIENVIASVGEKQVLGRGSFSTVINIASPFEENILAIKLTSGAAFLQKEYQETKTEKFDHRMSLADHLRVRQVIEDIKHPYIRQPKLYGFSLFLSASKEQIVEVIYMEAVEAQSFKDVYDALIDSSPKGLNLENQHIFNEYFNGNSIDFGTRLLGSYISLIQDLQEISKGKIKGRIGDVQLEDPGGDKNVLVDGYDPKSRRFSFVLLDVTEYEKTEAKSNLLIMLF